MSTYEAIEIGLAVLLFGSIFYWVVIGPQRARRERRGALGAPGQSAQTWDPRIYSRPRNR